MSEEAEQMAITGNLCDRLFGKSKWEIKKSESEFGLIVKFTPPGYDFEMTTTFSKWTSLQELVFGSRRYYGLMHAVRDPYDGAGWLIVCELRKTNPAFHAHIMKCFREKMVYADSFEELALKLEVV